MPNINNKDWKEINIEHISEKILNVLLSSKGNEKLTQEWIEEAFVEAKKKYRSILEMRRDEASTK